MEDNRPTRAHLDYSRQIRGAHPSREGARHAVSHSDFSGERSSGSGPTLKITIRWPRFRLPTRLRRLIRRFNTAPVRLTLVVMALVIVVAQIAIIIEPHLIKHSYAMGRAERLLQEKDPFLAGKLTFDNKTHAYNFNADYSPSAASTKTGSGGPMIRAVISEDPSKGLEVIDPVSNATFTITPKFGLLKGEKDGNRIVYPLLDGTGWLVFTMQVTSVKEDIVLSHANGDSMKLEYRMDLDSQGLAARLQQDGSVGIYGSSLPISGSVATGNDKDAALLQKARQNSAKDKFLFSLPTPVAYQANHVVSPARVHYELKGNKLTTVTTGLKKAEYPLTVDPAVTVIGTSDLFRDTNPESNIDLNATTGNIARGAVTGGVVTTTWTTNANNLATARFLNGATIYDDYAYVAGGAAAGSTSNITTVEYAAMSKVNSSIGTWSTTTALPAGLSRFKLIAYNGYMYAIGGSTTDTTCTTVSNFIYYNRIQTNGQLSGSWTTNGVNLPTGVCGLGATMYNDVLYVAGGRTGSGTANGTTGVWYAGINPNGSIGSFTTEDSTLPAPRYDSDLKIYNGYAYMIGGALAGTATNTTLVAPLASDGSLYGGAGSATWDPTSSMIAARTAMGGVLAAVNDGFMYVEGGCNTLNASQTCTATGNIQSDIEVAQINADGTLGAWSNIATSIATRQQVGGNLQFWRGAIYVLAGCSVMSTSAVQCTTALNSQVYDTIALPGELGPLHTGTPITTARYEHATAIVNGYLYVMGGCITVNGTNGCQISASGNANTTSTTYYAPINANGVVGSFTLDANTGFNNANGGLAAMGVAVYDNYIYLTGGYSYAQGAVNTTYSARSTSTGALAAAWATTSALTVTKYGMSALAYRGYVYTFGGCSNAANATGCLTTSYVTTVQRALFCTGNNSGTGGCGATVGTLGTWSTTGLTQLPAGRGLMGAAIYNGYIYLAGGATQANGGQDTAILFNQITSTGTITGTWTPTGGVLSNPLRRTDAYAMNGYLYVIGGHNGVTNTTYGTVQIGKINLSSGDIASMDDSVIQITPRWDARAAFANGYIYVTGGCTAGNPPAGCTTASTLDEYVEIYNAGNKGTGTWAYGSTSYTNRTDAAVTVANGYLYVAGGCGSYTVATSVCVAGNYLNTVFYAPLNPDGSVGSWASGGTLGASVMDNCMVSVGGYLYAIGGKDSTGTTVGTVYYSLIGASGLPGTWSTTTTLTTALDRLSCDTFNGHIYTTGGAINAGTAQTLVYYSPDLSGGGGTISGWTAFGTGFTTARYNHSTVIAAGYMYILAGYTGTTYLMDVQFIQLNPSTGASSGSWGVSGDLPNPVRQQSVFAANGYIYLSGGRSATSTCSPTTWIASINNTGILSNWSQAANQFTAARFGAGSAFYNGYYYLVGGDDCTNVISSNVIPYGGEQSPAMKATFSKYADLAGDGRPQKLVIYLTNAVNNGVDIELWQLTYKSSREAANSWGVNTTVSPLVNEQAYSVFAYDGSAVDQVIARWYWLSFDINMEQSFSFTDANQPTIYQYGLHYSPPPTKRLMHGRDFRDQTQQGEDLKL